MTTCMIYATAGSAEEARTIAKTLVSERLIACANIIDGATSVYHWEGQVETGEESILILKTSADRRQDALTRLAEIHSYETPCAVSYDMSGGLPAYLAWVAAETRAG